VISLAFEWPKSDVTAPGALDAYLRVRESLAPGVWRVPFDVPRIYLTFDLLNRSSLPLPMLDFSMALPGEAGAPRYECKFERSRNASSQRAVDPLWPGEKGTAMCSRAVLQPEEGAVLAAISTMRQAPELRLAVSADDAARQVRGAALSKYARLDPAWSSAQRLAAREPDQKWLVSDQPMEAPRPVLTLAQRLKSAGQALAGLMSVTVASLMLFVLGRTLQRLGVPLPVVVVVTIVLSVAAASVLAMVVAGPNPTAGDGWQRGATIGLVAGAGVGFVLFGALMLHLLHRRLDAENISWLDTVVSGWRNAFRLNGTATGGEFWGFYAHCLWLLVAARMALRPWDAPVCVLIIIAMMTLAKRRLAAFRPIEQIAIVAVPLLYVVVVILDR
jgi:hypothetical protein